MRPIVAIVAIVATPAGADSVMRWHGLQAFERRPAYVEIHAPTVAGAVASVTFQNEMTHNGDEPFTLDLDGLEISVELLWQVDGTDAERITVYPPDGYVAVPPQITVNEGQRDTLHIYRWEGM